MVGARVAAAAEVERRSLFEYMRAHGHSHPVNGVDDGTISSMEEEHICPYTALMAPFRIRDLPVEVILAIFESIANDRASYHHFAPPSNDLIAISETCRDFHELARPHIWVNAQFSPLVSAVATSDLVLKRGLRALVDLVDSARSGTTRFNTIPIERLSLDFDSYNGLLQRNEATRSEYLALLDLLPRIADSIRVLWIAGFDASGLDDAAAVSLRLLKEVSSLSKLEVLRFNQVQVSHGSMLAAMKSSHSGGNLSLPSLKSLQVMHGSAELIRFISCGPTLHTLLLWPERRVVRNSSVLETLMKILPQLRRLSLDVVSDPSVLVQVANRLKVSSSLSPSSIFSVLKRRTHTVSGSSTQELHAAQTPVALEELFVEGYLRPGDLSNLLDALALCSGTLKRLALYQFRNATPALIHDILVACPNLVGLTLVQGDTSQPSYWDHPLDDYIQQLRKFPYLRFFAFDRFSPGSSSNKHYKLLQFEVIEGIATVCKKLEKCTTLVRDVSEGATGYFAKIMREPHPDEAKSKDGEEQVTVNLMRKTEKDFLIDHWSCT